MILWTTSVWHSVTQSVWGLLTTHSWWQSVHWYESVAVVVSDVNNCHTGRPTIQTSPTATSHQGIKVPIVVIFIIVRAELVICPVRQLTVITVTAARPKMLTRIRNVVVTHRQDTGLLQLRRLRAGRNRISRCCRSWTGCWCRGRGCSCRSAHSSPLLSE